METKTFDCPIVGLIYTECVTETNTYYTLVPKPNTAYKMRVRSMDTEDEDGNIVPCYLRRLALPKPYNFDKNEMGIETELD